MIDALQRLAAGPALRLAVAVVTSAAILLTAASGQLDALSLIREYAVRRSAFAGEVLRHCLLVLGAVLPALVIGAPLGLLAARKPNARSPIFAVLNILQTIPSVALFVPLLGALGIGGVGFAPAVLALMLYALLPIVRNTEAGITGIDPAVVETATGMGFTARQILWRVELPLGLPVFLAGLRIVLVQAIGLAVVAALIGAGGLGSFVFEGLGQDAADLVLLGALPAILLALAADFGLQLLAAAVRR
jgi:osmoprotectant transport system permease protein